MKNVSFTMIENIIIIANTSRFAYKRYILRINNGF